MVSQATFPSRTCTNPFLVSSPVQLLFSRVSQRTWCGVIDLGFTVAGARLGLSDIRELILPPDLTIMGGLRLLS